MRTTTLLITLMAGTCLAQSVRHTANLTPSTPEISSSETFTVTYELSDVEGYVYVGIVEEVFDVIGSKRWEGSINLGETIRREFTLRLKPSMLLYVDRKIPVVVQFSGSPFGEKVFNGVSTVTSVKLVDYEEIQRQRKGGDDGDKTLDGGGSGGVESYSVTRVPQGTISTVTGTIEPRTEGMDRSEHPQLEGGDVQRRDSLQSPDPIQKSDLVIDHESQSPAANPEDGYDITWSADAVHFWNVVRSYTTGEWQITTTRDYPSVLHLSSCW